MPSHNITRADQVSTGNAVPANRSRIGVPVSNFVIESIVPIVADADGVSTTQDVAGSTGAFALINGLQAQTINGVAVAVFDVPRNVVAAWTTNAVITIKGTDKYGAPLTEVGAGGVATHNGSKAFKTVTSVTFGVDVTGVTVGTGIKLGLSYRPVVGGFLGGILNENSADAGTYVAPIRTASTGGTADVRGTYAYAGTANSTNVFTVKYIAANGPSNEDAFGIAQFV